MTSNNPFMTGTFGGQPIGATDAQSRIDMVQRFDADECAAALKIKRTLQKTVVQALQRRLKQLARAQR